MNGQLRIYDPEFMILFWHMDRPQPSSNLQTLTGLINEWSNVLGQMSPQMFLQQGCTVHTHGKNTQYCTLAL